MQLPTALLPHTVTVRPYAGAGPYGDVFADSVTVPALVEDRRRLVAPGDCRHVGGSMATATSAWAGDTIEFRAQRSPWCAGRR